MPRGRNLAEAVMSTIAREIRQVNIVVNDAVLDMDDAVVLVEKGKIYSSPIPRSIIIIIGWFTTL